MAKNTVIFYDGELFRLDVYADILEMEGFQSEGFSSAKELIERIKIKSDDICLMVLELVVCQPGNEFDGKRKDLYSNCALYLLDELDLLANDTIRNIPKIILTGYEHVPHFEHFTQAGVEPRVKRTFTKSDTTLAEFIKAVKELVQ